MQYIQPMKLVHVEQQQEGLGVNLQTGNLNTLTV